MAFCARCGVAVDPAARFCPACGAPASATPGPMPVNAGPSAQPSVDRPWLGGQILAAIGAAMLAIGPLLPWAELGAISANGLRKTDGEAAGLIVLGIVAVVTIIVSIVQRKRGPAWAVVVLGLLAGGWSLVYYNTISDQLAEVNEQMPEEMQGMASIGSGLYVCFVGAALLLLGGLAMYARHRQSAPHPGRP